MINLIGLYGPSRAGKDEIASVLVQDFGYEQRAQAAAIRKILLGLDPLLSTNNGTICRLSVLFKNCGENWDNVKAESSESVDLMISLGQTCRDVLGIDVWLNTAIPPIGNTAKIVISDVRQPNEYWAIKERGGKIWKVIRPDVERRGMDGLLEGLEFDVIIDNRGSLADLRSLVQSVITTNMGMKE